MIFTPYDNWKTLFFIKIYRYPEVLFNGHVLAFFEASDLKEVRILFFISTIPLTELKYNVNNKVKK